MYIMVYQQGARHYEKGKADLISVQRVDVYALTRPVAPRNGLQKTVKDETVPDESFTRQS